MRKGYVSALAAMLVATMGVFGSEIPAETAESTASAFLQRSGMARRVLPDRTVVGSERWGNLWIVNLSPSGHIVVSGTDKCAPIQQFSPDDFTEPAEDTPQLDVLTAASERCTEAEADPELEANSEWASYASSASSSTRRTKAGAEKETVCDPYVAPFLDASWHQGSPYSDFSPLTVVCGCMATAAGQEHRYWRWPYFIPKFRTITHGLRGNVSQTIRYNGFVPFDYDLIYGSYDGGDTPSKTGNDSNGNNAKRARYEAAYLTHWMQSMVKMSFGPGASGGTQKLCSEANEIYFEKGDVLNKYRNGYDNLWTAITNDLAFGSPINVNTPGHQMVIDGYGVEVSDGVQKDWININYGWGGGITWVDMRTEYDSRSLADFQIGYRPRKMVQIEPIAKKATGSVSLTFHLPPCYTNKVGAIMANICTVSDDVESAASNCGIVAIAQPNTATVFSLPAVDISSYGNGTNLRFYAYPVMSDGSDVVMSDPVDTTVGTPAASPSINSVSVRSNGIELLQDGFFAECAIGITNEIKVTCSNATQLNAYATRLTMLPDEKVSVTKDGDVFTVKLDATETPTDLSGDMLILTLAASNVDGTTVYENLMLRFSNVRRVVNGTYLVEEDAVSSEPMDFCGTSCELDANGKTLEIASGVLTGTGSVTLENTGSGGGFVFDTLNDFSGTLSLKDGVSVTLPDDTSGYSGTLNTISGTVPILGNLPATATLNIATGATNVLNDVSVLASITGGGTVCVTNGTNRLGNSSTFGGNIVVSGTGTVLTMNAGEQRNVTVGAGTTLYLELSEELYNFGYMTTAASLVTVEEGGTVYFKYGDDTFSPVDAGSGLLLFEPQANVWTATGTNDRYSATDHWSLGRLPTANEYAVFRIDTNAADYAVGFARSIELDLPADITLRGLKVASISGLAGTLTINQSGDHALTVQKFTNDTKADLNTTQILAENVEPAQRVLLRSDKPVAYTIDLSYENYFRMVDDPNNYHAVTNSAAWHGTVQIAGYNTSSPGLNPNNYGNENSVVRFKNVIGYLYSDVEYLPTIDLVDNGEYPALLWHNGSSRATTVFRKLTGSGVFRTRSPANGGGERVLIKDISEFTGRFDLESKTVALGGDAMPTTDLSSNGRLHICGNVTNLVGSVWYAADNVFLADDATLTVKGVIDTQTVVAYGSNAAVNLLDGGEIRVLSGSAASDPSSFRQNFYAGTFTLKDSITQENAINFRAGHGKHTTVDVAGLTLTLGPDAMTGSGDIFFTSPGSATRGRVVIQGLDSYSGTISVDDNVDIEFPESASSSACTLLVKDGQTVSVRAGNECNIIVEDGGTLNLVLTAEQILYGYDATSTVTVNAGGTVNFVDRSGSAVPSTSATATVYEPTPGVTTALSATAVWMTGDFDHPTNGYTLVLNSNVISNRNIFIESTASKGVTIDLPANTYSKASIIVRFRIPDGGAPLDNTAIAGVISTDGYPISAVTRAAGGTDVEGAYLNKGDSYNINTGTWKFTDGDAPSANAGHGYLLFAYQSDVYGETTSHGTAAYLGTSLENLYGGNKAGLQWGSKTIITMSIGGPVDDKNVTHPWAGLEIDGIAFFADQWLTAETAQDFAFPHTELNVQAGETLTVTAGSPRTYESVGTLDPTGTISIDNIEDLDVGTYTVARWRESKDPVSYGAVGTLDVAGLYEDYGAELVYDTTSISLRVFKAVYSATLSGGESTFSTLLFDPDLPLDYSRKTLEVNVEESSTLAIPAGGVTVKEIDINVASGKTLTLSGGAISADVIAIDSATPIAGTLALGAGTVIKLPADVASPVTLATTVTGTMSALMLGDSVYGGQWSLDGNRLTIKRYRAISINFGCNEDGGNASVGKSEWAGLASVTNWIDTAEYGANGTYPTMGKASIAIRDSANNSYPSMSLYINSRGGNWSGNGSISTVTSKILYGYIDDYSDSSVNSGVKVTGVNAFAAKYSAYVYFNADADIDSTDNFPPYYINGIMYRGDGSATVPGLSRWGTVKEDSVADGVNVLVVNGLTNDTLVVAQPNNMGGRGCIAAIQIVEDTEHDFDIPSGMVAVTVVPPSDDWSSRTLPTLACETNVTGTVVSFGSTTPTEYFQLLGGRQSIVALVTGGTLTEAASLNTELEEKSCGDCDLYLLISGGTITSAVGLQSRDWETGNGSQSGGNAMVQIGGDAVVGYAYGAGREGDGGTAPGSTGVTIMDAAVLTGSAYGGWSSYHQENPTVNGNTSVKVLNVQSVNSAANEQCLRPGAIVGGSVYGANTSSASTIQGSSSVVVDLSGLTTDETTNFVKKIIGGSAAFAGGNNGGTYAIGGNSSVTVTAPDNVIFTSDITGGGFIENNNYVYATVGGDSSVTLNGGTYSGITITAGGRAPSADHATVDGDATLTINGGVFTGATLSAGNADGEKTLVLGPGASISAAATVTGFTTIKLPAETSFPFTLATSVTLPDGAKLVIGDEEYEAEWSIDSGVIRLGGLSRTAVYTGEASPAEWESLPWNVTIAEANMPSATNTVIVTGSGAINLGSVTTAKVVFNVAKDEALTLSGTVTASEIYVTGLGSVVCSATNTLQGTISGDGTVVYDTVKPPTTLGWTNDVWTGTLVINNYTCGGGDEVYFHQYGNTNSIIKAPGFAGYSRMDTAVRCTATLVIDDGTTISFNNGNSRSGFRFAKLAGGGDLVLTGRTSATTQYVFEDVSAFTGTVTINADVSGDNYNRKSFVLGAPTDWTINEDQCNTYTRKLVIAGNVTVPTGKSWSASEGVSVLGTLGFAGSGVVTGPVATAAGATLDFSRSTAETPIDGTLTVASGTTIRVPEDATFPYNLASASAVVDESTLTLYIGDDEYADNWVLVDGKVHLGSLTRTTTFSGGASAWSDLWSVDFTDETRFTNIINVTASGTLALGSVNTSKIVFNVAEGVQLILMSGAATANEIYVTGLGEVLCYAGNDVLQGAFTGDGTVVYYGALPPTNDSYGWTNATWSGTVWLMNITTESALRVGKWCSEGSKLKFTNVKGYLPGMGNNGAWYLDYDGRSLGELVLADDEENPAYTRSNGYSHSANNNSYCMFSKLSGSGTFTDASGQTVYVVFKDASDFAGSIYLTNNTAVIIGNESPSGTTDYNGKIVVESGKSATIATGKTWKATNSGLLVKGEMAFAGTGAFEGNVTSESGSTLDFSASTSARPVTGTLTIANGTTIKLPADARFPYTLANAITISSPCSVNLCIGETTYSSTSLKVANGAIYRDRTAVFPGSESAVGWDALAWDIGYGDLVASNMVHATGDGTINLGTLSASKLYFDVDEGVELTLAGTASATEIYVTGLGSVVCSAANTLSGTIKGDGTIVYTGVKPPSSVGWTDEDAWTGVVWVKDIASNSGARVDWALQDYGNTNSTLRFTGVNLYFPNNATTHFDGTVDVDGAGMNVCDGYGGSETTIDRLSGTGTLSTSGGSGNGNALVVKDATGFAGTMTLTKYRVTIGDSSSGTSANGVLQINSGKSATVATGKTWTAPGGVIVNGDLTVAGTVTGNVTAASGATLDFSGSTSDKPVTGKVTIPNGTIVKLPAGATFPYRVADGVTTANPSTVTLWIGETETASAGIYGVDGYIYDAVPYDWAFINVNFTDGNNTLTTSDPVGLVGVPGTYWNNVQGATSGSLATLRLVDRSASNSTDVVGLDLEFSGTRGSYSAASLTSGSDLRHGYLDDNATYTAPSVTISGIPFAKYRVVVYHSCDEGNAKFGYDTVNEDNLYYDSSKVRQTGTTAWGSSGDYNSANAIEEGVNTLVSGVQTSSSLTVTSHRNSSRAGLAAIQVVKIDEATIDTEGPYTLAGIFGSVSEKSDFYINVTESATLNIPSATTIGAIEFNVASGKTLTLSGNKLTTTAGGFTVSGGGKVLIDVANAPGIDITNVRGEVVDGKIYGGSSIEATSSAGYIEVNPADGVYLSISPLDATFVLGSNSYLTGTYVTTTKQAAFEGITLQQFYDGGYELRGRFAGGSIDKLGVEATGYNAYVVDDGEGNVTSIRYEMQAKNNELKCVAITLTPNEGNTGIDVVANGAYYAASSNNPGFAFLNDDGTKKDGANDGTVGTAYNSSSAYSLYGLNIVGKSAKSVSVSGDTTLTVGTDIASAYSTLTVTGSGTLTVRGNLNVTNLVVESGATVKLDENFGARTITAASGATVAYVGGEGSSFDWATISGAGVVEIRSGVVLLRQDNSSLTGGVTVKSGAKLKPGSETAFGPADTAWVTVEDGGVVDIAGQGTRANYRIAGDGEGSGALVNSGVEVGNGSHQTCSIELTGDASVGGTGNFGMIKHGYAAVNLKFPAEGATLTKKGSDTFWLCHVTRDASGGNGTVLVEAGTLYIRQSAVDLNGVTLVFDGGTLGGDAALTVSTIDIKSGTPCNSFGQSLTATTVNVNAGGFARNATTAVTTLNVADGATANVNAYVQPSAVTVASGGAVMFENWSSSSVIDYTSKVVSGAGTIKFQGGETSLPVTFAKATVAGFTGNVEMHGNGNLVVNTEEYEADYQGAIFGGTVSATGSSAITATSGWMPLNVTSIESGVTLTVTNVHVSVGTNRPDGTIAFANGNGSSALSATFAGPAEPVITLNVAGDLTTANVTAYKPGGSVVETGATKTIDAENGVLTIALQQITIDAETSHTTFDALSVPASGTVTINTDHPVTISLTDANVMALLARSGRINLNATGENGEFTILFGENVASNPAGTATAFDGDFIYMFDIGDFSADSLAEPMYVPADAQFVFTNSLDTAAEYPSVLTVPATGAVKTVADLNFSGENVFASGATLEVEAGTAQFNFATIGAPETIAIAENATLAITNTVLTAANGITVSGEGTLKILEDLTVTGDVTMSDSATLAFADGASLAIAGDFVVEPGETLSIAPSAIAGTSETLVSATSISGDVGLIEPDDASNDYLLVQTETAIILKRSPKPAFTYDAYPGGTGPTGWFDGWNNAWGDNFATTSFRIGPKASIPFVYHTSSQAKPCYGLTARTSAFSIALYADIASVSSSDRRILAAFGSSLSSQMFIVYREGDYVKAGVFASNGTLAGEAASTAMPVSGYHLYTATLDPANGAIKLFVDDNVPVTASAGGAVTMADGFQIGNVWDGLQSTGLKRGEDMAVCAVRGFDSALNADSVAVLAAEFPATDGNVTWNVAPDNADNTYIVTSTTFGDSNYLGISSGRLTIPAGSTVNVKHLRELNADDTSDSALVTIAGTLNITSESTNPNTWADRNNNKGVLFGHWHGTGTNDITGQLLAPNTYIETVYTAETQLVDIHGSGAYVKTKALYANNNHSTVRLRDGGTLEVAEILSSGSTITKDFKYGTFRVTADATETRAINFSAASGYATKLDPYGHTLTLENAALTGSGDITVEDSSDAGNGKVVFGAGTSYTGRILITDANAANVDISAYTGKVVYSGSTARVDVLDGFTGTVYFTSNVDVSEIDLSGANINIADNFAVTATATKEGKSLVIGSGATLTLKVSAEMANYEGYFPDVSGSGTVTYVLASGESVGSDQIVGHNLMPYYNVWIPSADGNNTISADAAVRWRLGSLPVSGKNVAFKLDGDATVTIDATVSYNDVQVYGSGVLTIVQSGDYALTVADALYGTSDVGIRVESGLALGAAARLEVEGQLTVNSTLTVSASGSVGTLAVDGSGVVDVASGVTLTVPSLAVTGVVNMASSTSAFSGLTQVAGVGLINWNGKAPDTELWNSQATWKGTNSVANLTGNVQRKPEKWGYGDTYVRLSNVKGWLANSTTINPEVILDNGDADFGLEISDGSSDDPVTIFRKLSGDGTLKGTGTGGNQRYIFRDVTNFTGSIVKTDTVRVFVISASSTDYPARNPYKGYIYVASDGYAKIGAGKQWSVSTGGIEVSGEVELLGAASMTPSSSGYVILNAGSKIKLANAPLTVNGTLTLPASEIGYVTIDPGSIDMSGESAVLVTGITPSEALADGTVLEAVNVKDHPYMIVAAKENGGKIDIVAYNELPVASEGTDVSVPITWAFNNAASAITAQNPSTVVEMENLLATARGANGCTYLESYALGLTPGQADSKPTADTALASDGSHIEMFLKDLNVPEGVVLTVTAVKSLPGGEEEVLSEASVTVTKDSPNRVSLPIPEGRVQCYRLKVRISGPAALSAGD